VKSEVEGSVKSFGEFSNTAYHNYGFEDDIEKEKVDKIEDSKKISRESKMSTNSGRGAMPDAGLSEYMRMYIDEQRKRDTRREEERREENNRREEERRAEREQKEREREKTREREERL